MPQTFPTMNPTANRQPVFRSRRQLAPRRTERGRWPTRGMTLTLRERSPKWRPLFQVGNDQEADYRHTIGGMLMVAWTVRGDADCHADKGGMLTVTVAVGW